MNTWEGLLSIKPAGFLALLQAVGEASVEKGASVCVCVGRRELDAPVP